EYVLRGRERLGMLYSEDDTLVVNQLRYDEEIRHPEGVSKGEDVNVDPEQLGLSVKLVEKLSEEFEPEKYEDEYIRELEELIQAKAAGKKPEKKGKPPEPTSVSELLERLKESIEKPQQASV